MSAHVPSFAMDSALLSWDSKYGVFDLDFMDPDGSLVRAPSYPRGRQP